MSVLKELINGERERCVQQHAVSGGYFVRIQLFIIRHYVNWMWI